MIPVLFEIDQFFSNDCNDTCFYSSIDVATSDKKVFLKVLSDIENAGYRQIRLFSFIL